MHDFLTTISSGFDPSSIFAAIGAAVGSAVTAALGFAWLKLKGGR
jgi:hypothetical protein